MGNHLVLQKVFDIPVSRAITFTVYPLKTICTVNSICINISITHRTTLVESPARILYFVGSYTGLWQDYIIERLTGSYTGSYQEERIKDPVREAKFVGLLCNSLALRCIKSILGMEVLWDDRHQPHTSLLW